MSIFNPYILLAVVLAIVGSFGGGYYKGSNDEVTRQQLEIAALNAEARQKEQALVNAVTTQATKLQKANQDAKLIAKERDAAIASGALKLRIPIQAPVCPVQTTTDTAPASGDSDQERAELDAETAKSLVSITDSGDEAIRQLTACQQAYESIYETLKEKK
jgi:hypothetical protein